MVELCHIYFYTDTLSLSADTELNTEQHRVRAFAEEMEKLLKRLGFQLHGRYGIRKTECLELLGVKILRGNISEMTISAVESELQAAQYIHYMGCNNYGPCYILTDQEKAEYYQGHLDDYEQEVLEKYRSRHNVWGEVWMEEPMTHYDSDILIGTRSEAVYLFQEQFRRVADDMMEKGMLLVKDGDSGPLYSLPEFQKQKHVDRIFREDRGKCR